MTEEEQKAIELLKEEPGYTLDYYIRENAIDIVLNLINKQQKELDLKDKVNKAITYNFEKTVDKLEIAYKVIDLMAEKINDAYFEENDFYLWYEKILGVQKEENYNYMKNILKQYFYKKVEEEND